MKKIPKDPNWHYLKWLGIAVVSILLFGVFYNMDRSLSVLSLILRVLSPIFIGLMANEHTRKISFNFIKEYFKALLVPSVTLIYFFLAISLTGVTHAFGLIVALVLAISTLGIAGKKLDKLIN